MKLLGNKIYSIDLGIDWITDYEKKCQRIIEEYNKIISSPDYNGWYSVQNKNMYGAFFRYYLKHVLENVFPKVKWKNYIQVKQLSTAYVSNNKWSSGIDWHDHLPRQLEVPLDNDFCGNNKHLSTVFYLKKPVCDDGGIAILDDDNKQLNYIPKQGEFLIFPLHYQHTPLTYSNKEYRISINTLFCTENKYSDFL